MKQKKEISLSTCMAFSVAAAPLHELGSTQAPLDRAEGAGSPGTRCGACKRSVSWSSKDEWPLVAWPVPMDGQQAYVEGEDSSPPGKRARRPSTNLTQCSREKEVTLCIYFDLYWVISLLKYSDLQCYVRQNDSVIHIYKSLKIPLILWLITGY